MTASAAAPTDLARRLARFRAATPGPESVADPLPYRALPGVELAERLAAALDGEVVVRPGGRFVRVDGGSRDMPLDRVRLATLPDHPPPDRALICLDTETTGLATAAGTVAFLIGLGWWEGSAFRQVQLLLPDHADEPALLEEVARHVPPGAWLVTYNGRGFDWPLLVTRFRLARRAAPSHDGHLDLLPIVRRLFRHRMDDARLQTAERTLLGAVRHDDVDGWEIPGRYFGFLRGGPAEPLRAVVRHNDEDVRSLARLLALLDAGYGSATGRRSAPTGDLAGLARAFSQAHRHAEALDCLDEALSRDRRTAPVPTTAEPLPVEPVWVDEDESGVRPGSDPVPWWSPRARPDFGGRPLRRPVTIGAWRQPAALAVPWDRGRIAAERARLLRRVGRFEDAEAAWVELTDGRGRDALQAWIELAKLREHRLRDPQRGLEAAERGLAAVERRRRLGRPEPDLERDLHRRIERLRRRLARARPRRVGSAGPLVGVIQAGPISPPGRDRAASHR